MPDHQKAPRSVAITNGMTMVLPPEHVDSRLTGYSMANDGIKVRIGQNLASELIVYNKI